VKSDAWSRDRDGSHLRTIWKGCEMRTSSRPFAGFALAIAAVALSTGPVVADTEIGHVGLVGRHTVYDGSQDGFFGVVCHYRSYLNDRLNNIAVSNPEVYARDTTALVDQQRVGWRFIVKRLRPGATQMKTFYRSRIWKASANDHTPAAFPPHGDAYLTVPKEPGAGSQYFVFVRMFWYRDGEQEGMATHRLDDYFWEIYPAGSFGFSDPSCYGRKVVP
jgi:hypothetical protein